MTIEEKQKLAARLEQVAEAKHRQAMALKAETEELLRQGKNQPCPLQPELEDNSAAKQSFSAVPPDEEKISAVAARKLVWQVSAWQVFVSNLNAAFEAGRTYSACAHAGPVEVGNYLLRAWVQWQARCSADRGMYTPAPTEALDANPELDECMDGWVRQAARDMLGAEKLPTEHGLGTSDVQG